MPSFKQARDLYRLQKEQKKIQKELQNIHVEAEAEGVVVVMSAAKDIVDIQIGDDVSRERIPALLKDALNRVLKKVDVVAMEKMQGVMGELGLGGMEEGMKGMGS